MLHSGSSDLCGEKEEHELPADVAELRWVFNWRLCFDIEDYFCLDFTSLLMNINHTGTETYPFLRCF